MRTAEDDMSAAMAGCLGIVAIFVVVFVLLCWAAMKLVGLL